MSFLSKHRISGHVAEAIVHFNYALDLKDRGAPSVDISFAMFNALNKLQTEWFMNQSDQQIGEVKAFQTMLLNELPWASRAAFIQATQVGNLVALEPKILNHDTLRRGGYRPDVAIDQRLAKNASEEHRKLATAYIDFEYRRTDAVVERVIKRLAEVLYVVRSNIAHGEKTPYGPDLAKKERDEQVCVCAVPLQELFFQVLLERPCTKLVSYGTLAPEQSNHRLLSELSGCWRNCVIRGSLNHEQELSTFAWNPSGPKHNANVFISEDLPVNWESIDRFEGARYKRRLVPAELPSGVTVAYAYVSN